MTWSDHRDVQHPTALPPEFAGQLNGLVISQADRQWMHTPGVRPPRRRSGLVKPLSRLLDPGYTRASVEGSRRRARTNAFLYRVRDKQILDSIDVVVVS